MNAYVHAEISVSKRGGKVEDYLPLHDFMDCTKELCSDNRHRILHTMWGIKRVVVPLFGHAFTNSDGNVVHVKDICEQDHVLPDYRNKFIPCLSDFVDAMTNDDQDLKRIASFYEAYKHDTEIRDLLLSPLHNTGKMKSLFLTHNSWFVNEIIPKLFQRNIQLKEFPITPADLFNRMNFEPWMDNGIVFPKSASLTGEIITHAK